MRPLAKTITATADDIYYAIWLPTDISKVVFATDDISKSEHFYLRTVEMLCLFLSRQIFAQNVYESQISYLGQA